MKRLFRMLFVFALLGGSLFALPLLGLPYSPLSLEALMTDPYTVSFDVIKDTVNDADQDFTFSVRGPNSYSSTTIGGPTWDRPDPGTTCTLSNTAYGRFAYHAQSFTVDTNGSYTISAVFTRSGFIHLYETSFDPNNQCTNYLNGANSQISGTPSPAERGASITQALDSSKTYILVTSEDYAFADLVPSAMDGSGSPPYQIVPIYFKNTITGPGRVKIGSYPDTFTLDDANPDDSDGISDTQSFANVPAGTYVIEETATNGYVTTITCSDPSNNSSGAGHTAAINASDAETASCTFTNTEAGTITIIKDTVPDSPQDFSFTSTINELLLPSFVRMWGGSVDGSSGAEICTSNCSDGSSGSSDGEFNTASGITVDSSGNVYVADTANNRVQKFDSNGNHLLTIGGSGTGAGRFNNPKDVAVDSSGNIFVADSGNNRIQKFNSSGSFLRMWGGEVGRSIDIWQRYNICTGGCSVGINVLSDIGYFDNPSGIAVDAAGNVFVADTGKNRIQKFDNDGFADLVWGAGVNGGPNPEICRGSACVSGLTSGTEGGFMNAPIGIAVDASGNVYVADTGKNRIQKFDYEGNFVSMWGSGVNGGSGAEVCTNLCSNGSSGTGEGEFNNPVGLATDSSGNVYVADTGNHRVQKFAGDGNFEVMWGSGVAGGSGFESCTSGCSSGSSSGTGGGEFNSPAGIAVDSSGNTYVSDTNNHRVQTFSQAIGGGASFMLDDASPDDGDGVSNSITFQNLEAGVYTVTETAVSPYTTTITCVDPTGNTTTSGLTATIDVAMGETVTCTYTNTAYDLEITKTESADPVTAGSGSNNLTHEVTVTNLGLDVTGVVIDEAIDIPDSGVTIVSITQSTGSLSGLAAGTADTSGTWTIGNMSTGQSETLTIVYTVDASAASGTDVISDTASVNSVNEPDGNASNDSVTVATSIDRSVDLNVSKAESADPVVAGSGTGNLTHTVTVTNNGPSDASGVAVTEAMTLPSNVTVDSITPSAGTSYADPVWTIGDLADGASATLTILYTVDASAAAGTDVIENTATVTAVSETDSDSGNDSATVETSISRTVDIQVTKTESADPITAGSGTNNLTHTVTVTNNGPSDASNVVIDEAIVVPAGVTIESITPSSGSHTLSTGSANTSGTWTIATLADGASATLTVVYTADSSTAAGTDVITNQASLNSANESDSNSGNDSASAETSVERSVDIEVTKSESADPVVAGSSGGNLTHTVTVTNNGPSDASGLVIDEVIDIPAAEVTIDSITESTGAHTLATGSADTTGTWTIGNLASGSSASLTIVYTVSGSAADGTDVITNTALVNSVNENDSDSGNDSDSVATSISREVALTLTKTDNGATPMPGSQIIYTLTTANSSSSNGLNVVLTETVPAGTTFDLAASTAGWSCADGAPAGTVCTFNVGTVPGQGGSVIVDFVVTVADGTGGTEIVNEASISGSDGGADADSVTTAVDFLPASCDPNDAGLNYTLIMGTDRRDRITGTPGNDIIIVLGDHDTVDALEGNDCIIGGAGNDRIYGGPGDDIIWGGEENNTVVYDRSDRDRLYGREGNDEIHGGGDHDHIEGDEGNDVLYGDDGNDGMHGDDDNDDMFGGPGRDRMDGHDGNDEMHGGPDDDTLIGRDGNDDMFGDGGRDRLNGGDGNDTLHGGTEDDRLEGNDGNDDLFGDEGRDSLKGHDGDDYIEGGSEDDDINGGHDNDEIHGDGGNDRIQAERGNDIVYGGSGDDILDGHDGDDQLYGDAGDDELKGGKGDDLLDGGNNFDELDGGHDDDTCLNGEDLRSCELP
ncbi:MAG: 6-bladed beta-propeller [Chloroflexota bacterium]